jgi:hypothetical protein
MGGDEVVGAALTRSIRIVRDSAILACVQMNQEEQECS